VLRALVDRPRVIGIVDGYFERVPAVWHKEILWAMSRGVHVLGAASMGALRAAELHPFGMVGVGAIFEGFRDGELDALFTARAPSSFLRGQPHIARLFANTREAELAYFKKTGLFPIMHLIGIRRTLAEKHPWLPVAVFKAFEQSKTAALAALSDTSATGALGHPSGQASASAAPRGRRDAHQLGCGRHGFKTPQGAKSCDP